MNLLLSLLFSSLGLGYLMYGRRQRKASAFASGALLCIYPYFVSNLLLTIALGVGLLALPFFTEY